MNWLGDAIMTTPALLRLRQALPQAAIVLLAPIKVAGLWLYHPAINEVLTCSDNDHVFQIGRSLRRQNFETRSRGLLGLPRPEVYRRFTL